MRTSVRLHNTPGWDGGVTHLLCASDILDIMTLAMAAATGNHTTTCTSFLDSIHAHHAQQPLPTLCFPGLSTPPHFWLTE